MKTRSNSLLNLLFITLFFGFFNHSLFSQVPIGSGNFSYENLTVQVEQLSECSFNDAKITVTSPLGSKYKYSLNGSVFQVGTVFDNLSKGTYTLVYQDDELQCTSKSIEVVVEDNEAGIDYPLSVNSYDQTECSPNNSSINIISPLGAQFEYRINGGAFQTSPIFDLLEPGDYEIEYRNSISGCIHPNKVFKNIDGFPCEQAPEFICGVISNFIGLIQSPSSFYLVAPDNFKDILENNNISKQGINYQLDLISDIKLQLDYEEGGISNTKTIDVFNSGMYGSGMQDFNISDLSVPIENVNTSNFNGTYKLLITLKDGSVHFCDPVSLSLTTDPIVDPVNNNNFLNLPVLDCTTILQAGDVGNTVPKQSLVIGDIIVIKAFPIQLTDISDPNPIGIYSGLGIMPIPFGSKNVLVEFNNVFINEFGIITQGSVAVVQGSPTPSITNPEPLEIGGDICIPPPLPPSISGQGGVDPATGLDTYGFNPTTGLHLNGTAFDDNGFDINGMYKGTDPPSIYDPNGCRRDGTDQGGNPCKLPYSENDPIGPVKDFLEQSGAQINDDIVRILNEIKNNAVSKIGALNCNTFKSNVITKNALLDSPPCYTIGSNNKYVNIDQMLDQYSKPLVKSDIDASDKFILSKEMEDSHVDLYECALKAKKYQTIIDLIDNILADNTKLLAAQNYVKNQIKSWSEEEAANYIGDQIEFDKWLTTIVKEYLVAESGEPNLFSYIYNKKIKIRNIEYKTDYIDYYNSMATINTQFPELSKNTQDELDFYMKQDFQTIKGIDRVFYLEAMAKNISLQDVANNVHTLPVTIEKNVGNLIITLMLDKIIVNQTNAVLDAYIIVEDPESGRKIVFKGLNITFATNGTIGENKVFLGNDVEIRINNAAKLILKGNTDTYLQFNCEGFSGMGIDAQVEFCRNFIIPLTPAPDLTPIADPVTYRLLDLKTTMDKWLDFTFTINAPPFALAKAENIKFQLTNMVIDMSSSYSPPIKLPEGYQNPVAGSAGWKGFYVENITVTFPNEFNKNNLPSTAAIRDFIIDGTGVSGEGEYTGDILSLNDGRIGGWAMSINKLGLKFLHNNFARFSIYGQMEVPLFEEAFNYIGHIYPNKIYKFTVLPKKELTCDLLLAEAELTEGSGVSIGYDDLGFNISANLNGKLKVKGSDDVQIDLPEFEFEGITLSNRAPYFSPGNWPIPEDAGFEYGAFELNLNEAKMYKPDKDDPLSAGLYLNVTAAFDSNISIAIGGGIGIAGKLELEDEDGKQKWKFEKIKVHKFCIGGSFPGVDQVIGCLEFFEDDPDYGKGFKGGVRVAFSGFISELKAVGQFGKINGQSYFFVDASASLDKSIPLFAGIELKGFSGGISKGMTSVFDPNNLDFEEYSGDFDTFSSTLGVGFSGMTYQVDLGKGIGLKAGAMFTLLNQEEIFNGSLQIGITFHSQGGLADAYLNGIGQFLTPINLNLPIKNPDTGQDKAPDEVDGVLSAYVFLRWVPGRLTGTIEAFLNAGPLTGHGNGGKMVNIDIEFTSASWHIYIGHPDTSKRCGIDLNLEIFKITFDAYLCMGSTIPDMPEIPDNVKQIVPKVKSNAGLRGGGGGIIFGASFAARVSLSLIGIITANGSIGAGFDVMLRKYENMTCAGGNGGPIGFNGWYGAGQVYAYVTGDLSILGFNVIKAGVAAVLQARLPNPIWVQGTVGMYLDTWLYKGNFDLAIAVGENCNIVSTNPNNLTGIDVISVTNPINSAEEVNVDLSPEITFNMPINNNIQIKDVNGNTKKYFVKLHPISLTYGDANETVEFLENWTNNNQNLILKPKYFLAPYTQHKLTISVEVFEGTNSIVTETREISFTTGASLQIITESNIKSTFPLDGMKNFHKDEIVNEYIELNQGLYDVLKNENFKVSMLLNDVTVIPVTISNNATLIEFDISPYLSPEQTYKLELVRNPITNLYAKSSPTQQSAMQSTLYTINFRTSKYNTFAEKVSNINASPLGSSSYYGYYKKTDEPFDEIEYNPTPTKFGRLVSVSANVGAGFLSGIKNMITHGYTDNLLVSTQVALRTIYFDVSDPTLDLGMIGPPPGVFGNTLNTIYMNDANVIHGFYKALANQIMPYYNALISADVPPSEIPENIFYSHRVAPKSGSNTNPFYLIYRLPNGKVVSSHYITLN